MSNYNQLSILCSKTDNQKMIVEWCIRGNVRVRFGKQVFGSVWFSKNMELENKYPYVPIELDEKNCKQEYFYETLVGATLAVLSSCAGLAKDGLLPEGVAFQPSQIKTPEIRNAIMALVKTQQIKKINKDINSLTIDKRMKIFEETIHLF